MVVKIFNKEEADKIVKVFYPEADSATEAIFIPERLLGKTVRVIHKDSFFVAVESGAFLSRFGAGYAIPFYLIEKIKEW